MPALVRAEVGGIQKFIFATGKLKEMIGGSEIVFQICQEKFYEDILKAIGCARKAADETTGSDWHMLLQGNAGVLALLLPDEEAAYAFLRAYSKKALEEFPGLPLFGSRPSANGIRSLMAQQDDSWSSRLARSAVGRAQELGCPCCPYCALPVWMACQLWRKSALGPARN